MMAENYKILYEQMKKMVKKYKDDIVPGLRRVIDRLEAERQWISVEDRLPEPEKEVFVCVRSKISNYSYALEKVMDGKFKEISWEPIEPLIIPKEG